MPNRRYHIHVICANDDQSSSLDALVLYFERRAFLTFDLALGDVLASNHSRRRIDECDYVLLLIGDSYGKPNNTGVSQLHLSYINARTKNKPMLILRKIRSGRGTQKGLSRQLTDLIRLIEQQNSGQILYYDDQTDLEQLLEFPYLQMLSEHPAKGWIRTENVIEETLLTTFNAIKKSEAPPTRSSIFDAIDADTAIDSKTLDAKTLDAKTLNGKMTDHDDKAQANLSSELSDIVIDLSDDIMLNFSTHAYEGGNLSEVSFLAVVAWRDIVTALNDLQTQFTSTGIQRCVNDLVHEQALDLVQDVRPNAHAVSRTQVATAEQEWVKSQLLAAGWIAVAQTGGRGKRNFYQVTDKAKRALAE